MNKREYIQANKDWLEAKSKEDGVKALPKGIYYKVLSEGNSIIAFQIISCTGPEPVHRHHRAVRDMCLKIELLSPACVSARLDRIIAIGRVTDC